MALGRSVRVRSREGIRVGLSRICRVYIMLREGLVAFKADLDQKTAAGPPRYMLTWMTKIYKKLKRANSGQSRE